MAAYLSLPTLLYIYDCLLSSLPFLTTTAHHHNTQYVPGYRATGPPPPPPAPTQPQFDPETISPDAHSQLVAPLMGQRFQKVKKKKSTGKGARPKSKERASKLVWMTSIDGNKVYRRTKKPEEMEQAGIVAVPVHYLHTALEIALTSPPRIDKRGIATVFQLLPDDSVCTRVVIEFLKNTVPSPASKEAVFRACFNGYLRRSAVKMSVIRNNRKVQDSCYLWLESVPFLNATAMWLYECMCVLHRTRVESCRAFLRDHRTLRPGFNDLEVWKLAKLLGVKKSDLGPRPVPPPLPPLAANGGPPHLSPPQLLLESKEYQDVENKVKEYMEKKREMVWRACSLAPDVPVVSSTPQLRAVYENVLLKCLGGVEEDKDKEKEMNESAILSLLLTGKKMMCLETKGVVNLSIAFTSKMVGYDEHMPDPLLLIFVRVLRESVFGFLRKNAETLIKAHMRKLDEDPNTVHGIPESILPLLQ